MDELDAQFDKIQSENADEIAHQQKIEAAMPLWLKYCETCGRPIEEMKLAEGETVGLDEYIEMISIEPETMGKIHYTCGKCIMGGPSLP